MDEKQVAQVPDTSAPGEERAAKIILTPSQQKPVHLDKFMKGQMTPSEVHKKYGVRKSCQSCGAPASIRIRVLVTLAELTQRQPEFVANIAASNPDGPYVPTVPTKFGPMVLISDVGACDNCKGEAERAAAHHPSWAIVEINRGPKDVIQSQVTEKVS
jgi:hypothetical protein